MLSFSATYNFNFLYMFLVHTLLYIKKALYYNRGLRVSRVRTRPGLANEGRFFQRTGPTKREMSFLMAGSGYKKGRRIILRVSPGRQNKDEVLKPADKSLIMNIIKSTIIVNVPMKCVFQFSLRVLKKNH